MSDAVALALTFSLALLATVLGLIAVLTRRVVSTPAERAVHDALQTAALAARPLRKGLNAESARGAAPHLRELTGSDGLALYDDQSQLLHADRRIMDACEFFEIHLSARSDHLQHARFDIEMPPLDQSRKGPHRLHDGVLVGRPARAR